MLNIKVKPLNENPEKVLELLNSNKCNLSSLQMQYDNIVELYLQLLGAKDWGKPNINEILLPEIEKLLEEQNYNCKFTKTGIYQNNTPIFTLLKNEQQIDIKSGENYSSLYKSMINAQNGILLNRMITDFSKLSKDDKCFLSKSCLLQIEEPEISKNLQLEKIDISSSIANGIELSKQITENYVSMQNSKDFVLINTTISYHLDSPIICYKSTTNPSENLEEANYLSLVHYGANPPITKETCEKFFYNYGDFKFNLKDGNTLDNGDTYNYENLLENLHRYQKNYPNTLHPILTSTYLGNWKEDWGEKVRKYIINNLSHDDISKKTH